MFDKQLKLSTKQQFVLQLNTVKQNYKLSNKTINYRTKL